MKPLVTYHGSCADGFGSAYAAWRHFGPDGCDFLPAQYGTPPPDESQVRGRDVYLLDFSYKRPAMEWLLGVADTVTIIDHHKSAAKELAGLVAPNARLIFDLDRSGAVLTWQFFFPELHVPLLLLYVEARDLWKFDLPHSREVSAAIASYPHDFTLWDLWIKSGAEMSLAVEGAAILRYQNQCVEGAIKHAQEVELLGHQVLAVNATHLISEIANRLALGRAFGTCWFLGKDDKFVLSFRSTPDGIDVEELAARLGGGGHPRAAGAEGYALPWRVVS